MFNGSGCYCCCAVKGKQLMNPPPFTCITCVFIDRREAAEEDTSAAVVPAGEGLRYRVDGGVNSEVDGAPGKDIYFMGIIDILQVSHQSSIR